VLQQLDAPEVLEAASGEATLQCVRNHSDLDLVLLDLHLPDRSGLDVLDEIGNERPELPVVILSAQHDEDTVRRSLDGGAMGFIPKASLTRVLIAALRLVLSGSIYVPAEIGELPPLDGFGTATTSSESLDFGLTDRQREVLALMALGLPNKIICKELSLSLPTVKGHVTSILKALNVNSRTQAVLVATRLGIVSGP
jgi:DNA-binding NarL/FixJ family response regulator